jgi:glutamate--cysteine ligase
MSVLANEKSEPITSRAQLISYFADAAKPKADWRAGSEYEKFIYRPSNLKTVSWGEPNGLRDLMYGLTQFGWTPVMEGENIIGLRRGAAGISLEPGGQFELAGAPMATLHETAFEIDEHIRELNQLGEAMDIGVLSIGFHPTARREDIKLVPKGRYYIQYERMPTRGALALDMMLRTCAIQTSLDFSDEQDMVKKFRVALALQPIITGLFASSPFTEGRLNGYNSYRMHVWSDTDPSRTGALPFVFEEGFGFERYVEHAIDVPMQFIFRNDGYLNCEGESFRQFLDGKLPQLPGEVPTTADWANHLTTLFTDVRLKKVLEMRGADAGCPRMMLALPSFWVGLLYDDQALDAAWEIVKCWNADDRIALHNDVPRDGLRAKVRGRIVHDVAIDILAFSKQGLTRRNKLSSSGQDESSYLDILFEIVDSGENCADKLIKDYKAPGFDMQNVFNQFRLKPRN